MNSLKKEIKKIAENSFLCTDMDISHLCGDNHSLYINHVGDNLKFTYTDNSKPYLYKEMEELKDGSYGYVEKTFTDKTKCISYIYPLNRKYYPPTLVATSWNLFNVFEYKYVKGSKAYEPDYREVKRIIYKALKKLGI